MGQSTEKIKTALKIKQKRELLARIQSVIERWKHDCADSLQRRTNCWDGRKKKIGLLLFLLLFGASYGFILAKTIIGKDKTDTMRDISPAQHSMPPSCLVPYPSHKKDSMEFP